MTYFPGLVAEKQGILVEFGFKDKRGSPKNPTRVSLEEKKDNRLGNVESSDTKIIMHNKGNRCEKGKRGP